MPNNFPLQVLSTVSKCHGLLSKIVCINFTLECRYMYIRTKVFNKTVVLFRFRWLCTVYTCFLVGAAVNVVLTDVGKYTVGRLRPHFLAVCKPDFSKLNCTTGFKKNFITNYECTGDKDLTKEARLSFPSGHSSFAGIRNRNFTSHLNYR